MKQEIRVLGIDDSPFKKRQREPCLIIGTLFRGGHFLDGVMTTTITPDGDDATQQIAAMINRSKFKPQIRAILTDGICVGGFNIIDIAALHEQTSIPVIAVMRRAPDIKRIRTTLSSLGMKHKIPSLESAGAIARCGNLHIQHAGITPRDAQEIITLCTTHANIPEALRIAHIIAAGIAMGESKGNS